FVDRQFQCLVPPVFQVQRKISCVSEVSLLNWNTDQAVFSETRQAAELLQQFGGFFCRSCLFRSVWPCTIPVPALRPCLTNTAFSSPWYAQLSVLCDNVLALLLWGVSSLVMGIRFSTPHEMPSQLRMKI